MADLNIKSNIEEDFINIEKDIKEIEDILANIYSAFLTLDEKKWKSKEKTKLDQELEPYLSNISTNFSKNLSNRLNYLKSAIAIHKEVDTTNAKQVENEVSTTIVESL